MEHTPASNENEEATAPTIQAAKKMIIRFFGMV
jgi:hypothetical protein